MLKRIWREPLVHFLVVGILVFAAFEFRSDDETSSTDVIQVDSEALLYYVRHRYRLPGREGARTWLSARSGESLQTLLDDYVLEEALFREAKSLQLDADDYGGRRRLISQLEYLNRAFIGDSLVLDESQLRAYYEANSSRYINPASITFAHVYFNTEQRGEAAARASAEEELRALNESGIGFNDAGSFGDRFLYHRYYADRDFGEIQSHFGESMAEALRTIEADTDRWVGPLRSAYGFHLVMIARQMAQQQLTYEQVADRVLADATMAKTQELLDEVNNAIKSGYRVEITGDLLSDLAS